MERIEKIPAFESELDPLTLAEFRVKHPEIAHVLERVSVETVRGKWVVQKLCELNNSYVRNLEGQEETNALLRDLVKGMEDLSEQVAQVQQQSNANAKTILDWTVRFKSPLSILGAFLGIAVTALVSVLVSRLWGK